MNRGLWLALAAGSVLAWLQLGGVPGAVRIWAVVLLVPLPALMVVQAGLLRGVTELPRIQAYASSIASLWMLAGVTAAIAYLNGFDPAWTAARRPVGLVSTSALVLALTAAGVGLLFLFRALGVREPTIVRELMPVTARERLLFIGVAATAGVCEEFLFRGFLLAVLLDVTGHPAVAVILSSGAFGVVHAYQGAAGALRAALLGAMLAVPLLFGLSIVTAIAAHTLIDLLSGLWLARYLLRN